ncbi:MAG: hypothetical protein CMK09_03865 [Ponticaulis sp.]|nr:hypothetical protein [Ponticaulis sp.]|tara:strand:+ start:4610 stop:4933 length:324 start_codon:yes stop_codon:yes gene_type:complete
MIRIAFQVALILLPIVLFAIYRIATRHRREPGEPWPILILVISGLVLSSSFYIYLFLKDPRDERTCSTPPRFENGVLIPAETVPCEEAPIDSRRPDTESMDSSPDDR